MNPLLLILLGGPVAIGGPVAVAVALCERHANQSAAAIREHFGLEVVDQVDEGVHGVDTPTAPRPVKVVAR
ncbi:hypothetical protein [Micromonospora inyonensis]|uniref:Uncharacterized protein n=1 Tax=Micromonospora inyonensis TaxID=47866 RepID=A0A1C6S883_9ACTN|nr:hypothetical protein [Micromonospora inyonensis]SCL20450.1 hypothetical protein GA0074694_3041 [Micromonospora inyonensis]SCL25480.1 hypothetical protein GA0074694_4232 [Micromonospora inyonensis]